MEGSGSGGMKGDDFLLNDGVDDDARETAQEKRIRLAKSLLNKVRDEEDVGSDINVDEAVADRLHSKALDMAGRLTRNVAVVFAEKMQKIGNSNHLFLGGHNATLTAITFGKSDDIFWTASKDCTIVRWNVTGKKEVKYPGRKANRQERKQKGGAKKSIPVGHFDEILALAASDDGKYLVSAGRDRVLHIWNAITNELIDSFRGHRDVVTSLCFQKKSRTLFSGSYDRSIKIWNLDEMTYVDTLFGHQSYVLSLDCLRKERPISGGDDRTLHLWKVESDSQLIFRGHTQSMDTVAMLDDQNYISGSQDGTIALWNINKKKPIFRLQNAHTVEESTSLTREEERSLMTASMSSDSSLPCWINCLAMLPSSDLFASGSNDGYIRFWHADLVERSIKEVGKIPANGFVNCLSFSPTGKYLVAGIGREHRLGKWSRQRTRNGVVVVKMPDLGFKV